MARTTLPKTSVPTDGRAGADRLRVTPVRRRRNWPRMGVGLVLIVGLGLVGAKVYVTRGERQPVLAVARAVPAGRVIQEADLAEVRVGADSGLRTVPASARATVVGRTAVVELVPGALLSPAQVGTGPALEPGKAVVAVSLKGSQLPAKTLRPGDHVTIMATGGAAGLVQGGPVGSGPDSRGAVLVPTATVYAVEPSKTGETVVVSVVVGEKEAPGVVGAAAVNQVSLVLKAAA